MSPSRLGLMACFALNISQVLAGPSQTVNLSDAVYHRLDFWLGEWEVVDASTQEIVGHARLEKLLKGAVVTMIWSDLDGSEIREWFFYDPAAEHWEQLFISDTGVVKRREMVSQPGKEVYFIGSVIGRNGQTYLDKSTVGVALDGTVHQVLQRSKDAGKTWDKNFDGIYRRTAKQLTY